MKPNIINISFILIISYICFKAVKVKSKTKLIDMNEEYRLSIFSSFISFGLLLVITCVLNIYNGLEIPTNDIVMMGVGCLIGFGISVFIVRYPNAIELPEVQRKLNKEQRLARESQEIKNLREQVQKKSSNELMAAAKIVPYEGKEDYIFISYAHKDTEMIIPILKFLQREGFRIWYDEGIALGSEWPEDIAAHLAKSKVCLAFISQDSLKSNNCRREINFALSKNKDFLSIILKPVNMTPGVEMQISTYQSLLKYKYETEEDFLEALLNAEAIQCCKDKYN